MAQEHSIGGDDSEITALVPGILDKYGSNELPIDFDKGKLACMIPITAGDAHEHGCKAHSHTLSTETYPVHASPPGAAQAQALHGRHLHGGSQVRQPLRIGSHQKNEQHMAVLMVKLACSHMSV